MQAYGLQRLHILVVMGTRFSSEVGSAKSLVSTQRMDGESIEQDLLIVLWEPEPEGITKEIKRRFPYLNVTYFCLRDASKLLANETDHLDSPAGLRKMRYVYNELISSRQFDDLETATSQERLVGRSTIPRLVAWIQLTPAHHRAIQEGHYLGHFVFITTNSPICTKVLTPCQCFPPHGLQYYTVGTTYWAKLT